MEKLLLRIFSSLLAQIVAACRTSSRLIDGKQFLLLNLFACRSSRLAHFYDRSKMALRAFATAKELFYFVTHNFESYQRRPKFAFYSSMHSKLCALQELKYYVRKHVHRKLSTRRKNSENYIYRAIKQRGSTGKTIKTCSHRIVLAVRISSSLLTQNRAGCNLKDYFEHANFCSYYLPTSKPTILLSIMWSRTDLRSPFGAGDSKSGRR